MSSDALDKIAALKQRYAASLGEKLAAIQRAARQGLDDDSETAQAAQTECTQLLHKLTGSAGTFGFPILSKAAGALERAIIDHRPWKEIAAAIDDLSPGMVIDLVLDRSVPMDSIPATRKSGTSLARILMVSQDSSMAEGLAGQLRELGYAVRVQSAPQASPDDFQPDMILLDADPLAEMSGGAALVALSTHYHPSPPVAFLSNRSDTAARLAAVRYGAVAYFTKPVRVTELVDTLSRHFPHVEEEPIRALLVEDDMDLVALYRAELATRGMLVEHALDPESVIDVMHELHPDIVVMDLFLPTCMGTELAQVIRQHAIFASIPILFLSTESNIDRQIEARRVGADDFLTKPVTPAQLASAIVSRAERYRQLRRLMQRDSLTGLLNHGTVWARIDAAAQEAERRNTPLSLAVIDIDRFKLVNDTFGHLFGDMVLKSLSQMLMRRLRRSDIVGRVGGEEFVVVMPNTSIQDAQRRIDELRQSFSQIEHHFEDDQITASFSSGVALMQPDESQAEFYKRADEALYAAKHAGRNRVITAG
ncbi:MAG: diguanylate cyclase [Alphaproteobacteria bacterium]|nr:diguanylate cyclase [Alphaproteobacteria bacterium]MBU0798001.1 diguanylate cyclase [Alphaproteobacteria bacterium]MBU0886223.1 diguanylate cyclase [Alphaproteobacteria bacterium]MBU1814192.1 diguanylate cyclase [Alphaproteobacteria bacterium]